MATPTPTIGNLVRSLAELRNVMDSALEVRYDAPPALRDSATYDGIYDPTVAIALDKFRMALSDEVRATERVLAEATRRVDRQVAALRVALDHLAGE